MLGLGRGQGAGGGVQAELGRAVQERRRGGGPPRPWARAADRSSSAATSSSTDGRLRQVPGAAVRIEIGIGRRRQDDMDPAAIVGGDARYTAERTSGWRKTTRPPS